MIGILIGVTAVHPPAGCRANALDDGIDPVAILLCIIEALENDRSSSFADHGAISVLVEGPGKTVF